MTLHNHEKPVVLATVFGTVAAPLAAVALGAPGPIAAVVALAAPFFALIALEGRLEAHHRAFPTHR